MSTMNYYLVLRRWLWVIISIVAVTGVALALWVMTRPPLQESTVRMQLTTPETVAVPLFDATNRSASYLRDDLLMVRNNFQVVLESREVRDRTIRQLGLTGLDNSYQVEVNRLRESDFMDLAVSARSLNLAQAIAEAHAAQAVQYYGELRAKPAAATKAFLAAEVAEAQARLVSEGDATNSPVEATRAQQERETYQLLLKKYSEAALAEENALRAGNIQIVESRTVPPQQSWIRNFVPLAGLALAGSLGLGLLTALLLESAIPQASRVRYRSAGPMSTSAQGSGTSQ